MAKFDKVRMAELVKVEETADALVLTFQGDLRVTMRVADGGIVSEVS